MRAIFRHRHHVPRIAMAALLLFAAGCARPGAPSGGPEDTIRPAVLATLPESLGVGVPTDAAIVLELSESVSRDVLDRALWIHPQTTPRKISVSGTRAELLFREDWPESTTITVLISTQLEDKRRNSMAEPYQWSFTTGDSIAPGVVRGSVEKITVGKRGQALVAVYPVLGDTLPDPMVEVPDGLTQVRSDGSYRIPGLVPDGRLRMVYAMADANANREILGPGEYFTAQPESLLLTPENPTAEISLRLVDPAAPGNINGTLLRETGDSTAVGVELFPAEDDSLRLATVRAAAAADGGFSLLNAPPGGYRIAVYCDGNGNGFRDPREPLLVVLDQVVVLPGVDVDVGELPGPRCLPPKEE